MEQLERTGRSQSSHTAEERADIFAWRVSVVSMAAITAYFTTASLDTLPQLSVYYGSVCALCVATVLKWDHPPVVTKNRTESE